MKSEVLSQMSGSDLISVRTPQSLSRRNSPSMSSKFSFFAGGSRNSKALSKRSSKSSNVRKKLLNRTMQAEDNEKNSLYPNLSALYQPPIRFGKKMFVQRDPSSFCQEVKDSLQDQINHNRKNKSQQRDIRIIEEKRNVRARIDEEIAGEQLKERERQRQLTDFMGSLKHLEAQRVIMKKEQERINTTLNAKHSFFPFTYGEKIEKTRDEANSRLKEQMKMHCDRIHKAHLTKLKRLEPKVLPRKVETCPSSPTEQKRLSKASVFMKSTRLSPFRFVSEEQQIPILSDALRRHEAQLAEDLRLKQRQEDEIRERLDLESEKD